MTKARIYQPTKTAMQSGKAKARYWILDFIPKNGQFIDPLTGWTGSTNPLNQVQLKFDSIESAIHYAQNSQLDYTVETPHTRLPRRRRYSDNFSFDRPLG